ncbi:hypothetical protein O181_089235 [Austropuccinia psidii MF-1]|uniref:Uncharacterized protein n=1 Tax=Austropuccinia psidii MF-1 TaxID=1389203 RepID=A0A9Q3ITE9_9BASI|nr:hypothetical protein [Austropuccinia psidii MF-1]
MTGDEVYASLPLVHNQKFTGCHHPYAPRPRRGHASSSRKKNDDDEDENMSPTQSETNDGPIRRELIQIVSPPTLKCPWPRVCLINLR